MRLGLLKVRDKRSFAFALSFTVLLFLTFLTRCGDQSATSVMSRKLFVVNSVGNSLSVFDLDEILTAELDENRDVDVAPVRSIGSVTGLSSPQGIFVDTASDEIFVANTENKSINVYDNDMTEEGTVDVPPKRTIKGNMTNLSSPVAVFVDANEIFVANSSVEGGSITVYKNNGTKTGDLNISPERTIRGGMTGLFRPSGIFVDAYYDEIFVTDFNRQDRMGNILVFERTADSTEREVYPIRVITITDTTDEGFPFFPMSVNVDVENDELFIADFGVEVSESGIPFPIQESANLGSTIKVYRRTDADNEVGVPPSPLRTIRGPRTGLLNPVGIFVDTHADEIFVVNFFNNTVTVYENDRSKNGDLNDSPSRTLFIRDTNNSGLTGDRFNSAGIFVDAENDEIFVVNRNNTIAVYGSADERDTDPRRTIGSNTGLLSPEWIHIDTANGEIYVSNASSQLITVYGIADKGNVAPLRTIPQGVFVPKGISMDAENDVLFVAGNAQPDSIRAYQATDGTPLRLIFGSNTGLGFPEGLYLDMNNDEIFVANTLFDLRTFESTSTITIYDSEASGNTFPKRTIKGLDTELSSPSGVFVDTERDEIFVANFGSGAITVYGNDKEATGDQNIRPMRTIKGPNTRILGLRGVFVDTRYDLIFATNFSSDNNTITNTITVYKNDRTKMDDPNTTPIMTITGPRTGLSKPIGIFITDSP